MPTSTTGYVVSKASTPFINWTDLWHIIIASVAAGAGLAIAFGLILLGIEFVQEGKDGLLKASGGLLSLLAAAFCVLAIVVGIHVMVNPPKTKPLKVTPANASSLVSGHHARTAHRADA